MVRQILQALQHHHLQHHLQHQHCQLRYKNFYYQHPFQTKQVLQQRQQQPDAPSPTCTLHIVPARNKVSTQTAGGTVGEGCVGLQNWQG